MSATPRTWPSDRWATRYRRLLHLSYCIVTQIFGSPPYIPLVNRFELEDAVLGADVSRLPLESVPVNVWDEEDELPQDLSVADERHLPFLKEHPDPQRRIAELFGEVVMFDDKGNAVTRKTVRPGKEEIKLCV